MTFNAHTQLYINRAILLTGGIADDKIVESLSNSGSVMVQRLFSRQEEANMRMVLHAIMQCDDIHILVILLYYDSKGLLTADI